MQSSRLLTAIKTASQLGLDQVALYAVYRFGLASGHYRRSIRPPAPVKGLRLTQIAVLPDAEKVRSVLGEAGLDKLLWEAELIIKGKYRQFGDQPVEIRLTPPAPLAHWTAYETGKVRPGGDSDIKLVWEPARFDWAVILGRAYHISREERFAEAFWRYFEAFTTANPPYLGPNWMSGQEVGLRSMAWVWAGCVFASSPHSTAARMDSLAAAVAEHAHRIPGTLVYARSQNNNHLLTEAAALYTVGLALPGHPEAAGWLREGKRWLGWCFSHQIDESGEYVQHSMNYHRLMLNTTLWIWSISHIYSEGHGHVPFDQAGSVKLKLAARWLLEKLDPVSGQAPNLGANDGALVFPFSVCEFSDFRPTAQASARVFLSQRLPPGTWDETACWLGLREANEALYEHIQGGGVLSGKNSWASLRAVKYQSRPSHADQLICDLWWRGMNIARDPGTFRYNAAPPWDNRLTSTLVHNTVSVNGQEQMTRAGRFLYLDWAKAAFHDPVNEPGEMRSSISASTNAYASLGVDHERKMTLFTDDRWLVEDLLNIHPTSGRTQPLTFRLHWLLPDWEWKLENEETALVLRLNTPHGWMSLAASASAKVKQIGLIRAGDLICGEGLISPVFGWFSPTYNVKNPALSFAIEVQSEHSFKFSSEFIFPGLG